MRSQKHADCRPGGSVPQRPWWGFVGGIPQNTSFTRDESPLAV